MPSTTTLRRTRTLRRGAAASIVAASVVVAGLMYATPAFAASEMLPEDPTLPVIEFNQVGAAGNSGVFQPSTARTISLWPVTNTPSVPVVVVAIDAEGNSTDIGTGQAIFELGNHSGAVAATVPAVDGRYELQAYSLNGDGSARSALGEPGVMWVDGANPDAPVFNEEDGFVTDDASFRPTITFEKIAAEQFAEMSTFLDYRSRVQGEITSPDGTVTSFSFYDVNNDGTYTIQNVPELYGTTSVTLTLTDAAGNSSSPVTWSYTVAAPLALAITSPANGSTVTTAQPTITGTGTNGASVTVNEGENAICSATVVDGTWSCVASDLGIGEHTIIASTDAESSEAVTFTLLESTDPGGSEGGTGSEGTSDANSSSTAAASDSNADGTSAGMNANASNISSASGVGNGTGAAGNTLANTGNSGAHPFLITAGALLGAGMILLFARHRSNNVKHMI